VRCQRAVVPERRIKPSDISVGVPARGPDKANPRPPLAGQPQDEVIEQRILRLHAEASTAHGDDVPIPTLISLISFGHGAETLIASPFAFMIYSARCCHDSRLIPTPILIRFGETRRSEVQEGLRGPAKMFELIYLFLWIFKRRAHKEAAELERRHEQVMHPLRFGSEFEFDPEFEDRVMQAVQEVVCQNVAEPETAAVTDYAFYGPTERGVSVYVELECTNVVGSG
jgi:hypothetical protein